MDSKNIGKLVLIGLAVAGIYYLITTYSKKPVVSTEHFYNEDDSMKQENKKQSAPMNESPMPTENTENPEDNQGTTEGFADSYGIQPSQSYGSDEIYQMLDQSNGSSVQGNAYPADCFPKDQLTPSELLPADANSKWAQSVPSGQGELGDQNFLNAGYHIGVNTVGQTLRNANRQLRSEPLNPQQKVSPWLQTTIEPDVNRRPMEIGGCQ